MKLNRREATRRSSAGKKQAGEEGQATSALLNRSGKLLLSRGRPAHRKRREGTALRRGGVRRAPRRWEAEVLVDGTPAAIADDGRFRVRVPSSAREDRRADSPSATRASRATSRTVPLRRPHAHIKAFAIR